VQVTISNFISDDVIKNIAVNGATLVYIEDLRKITGEGEELEIMGIMEVI
jgi:uncharacterized protein related to proFAR isomerase